MAQATIDRLPVAQLPERYGISRTVLYERLNALQITPQKRGNKAFVNAEQLALLDALHDHLKQGGSTVDFLEKIGLSAQQPTEQSTGQLAPTHQIADLVRLVEAISSRLAPAHPGYRESFRFLEEAYQNEWLLSTSHLADLLELSSVTISHHSSLERYGFMFTKAGRNGTEIAWRVDKVSTGESYSYARLPDEL